MQGTAESAGVTSQLPRTMSAVVCHGPRDYRLDEVDVPVPGPGEALVRVEAVGICASDLKCYGGAPKFWGDESRPAWTETLVVPGHEFVGRIVQVDDKGRRHWAVEVGDRVVSEQIVPCWVCFYCRRGQYWLCEPHDIYGFKRNTPGAMAPYMVFPAGALVHKISEDVAPAHAAFAEPLACALHAVERANITFDDAVVVAGCGPIGLGMIVGAVAKGAASVIALDMSDSRLAVAGRCGAAVTVNVNDQDAVKAVRALTGGRGADVYLEATGHPAAVSQGLNLLRKRGTYVEYGVFGSEASADWSIISDDKELDVLGAHLGSGCWPAAIRFIESDALPLDDICSHQLPLSRFQEGLDLVGDGRASIKVTLIP